MPNVSEGKTATIIAAQRMAIADALNGQPSRTISFGAPTICERATVKAGLSIRRHLIQLWAADVNKAYTETYLATRK